MAYRGFGKKGAAAATTKAGTAELGSDSDGERPSFFDQFIFEPSQSKVRSIRISQVRGMDESAITTLGGRIARVITTIPLRPLQIFWGGS